VRNKSVLRAASLKIGLKRGTELLIGFENGMIRLFLVPNGFLKENPVNPLFPF
jgi:hypothetical protein